MSLTRSAKNDFSARINSIEGWSDDFSVLKVGRLDGVLCKDHAELLDAEGKERRRKRERQGGMM